MVAPERNSTMETATMRIPAGDMVKNESIYTSMQKATVTPTPANRVKRKNKKAKGLAGSISPYGAGRKAATKRIGRQHGFGQPVGKTSGKPHIVDADGAAQLVGNISVHD